MQSPLIPKSNPHTPVIRASEIGQYVFCQRAWWLGTVQGYRPVNVEVVPSMFSLEEAFPTLFKVKSRDVIVFSRQLATLIRSGISLLPALEILGGQVTTSRAFKKILESIVTL